MMQSGGSFRKGSYAERRIAALYGTRNFESSLAAYIADDMLRTDKAMPVPERCVNQTEFQRALQRHARRRAGKLRCWLDTVAIPMLWDAERRQRFFTTLGEFLKRGIVDFPAHPLVFHALEAFEELRTAEAEVHSTTDESLSISLPSPPSKGRLRLKVSEKMGREIAPKEWERALKASGLWMLDQSKAGRKKGRKCPTKA